MVIVGTQSDLERADRARPARVAAAKKAQQEAEDALLQVLDTLDDATLAHLSGPMLEQCRKRVRRHRGRLAAYSVELAEAEREIPELEALLGEAKEREQAAKKAGHIETLIERQRETVKLSTRLRSARDRIPEIEKTISELESGGPAS